MSDKSRGNSFVVALFALLIAAFLGCLEAQSFKPLLAFFSIFGGILMVCVIFGQEETDE